MHFARFGPFLLALALFFVSAPARGDDWPGWLGPQRDGVWRENGVLQKFPKGGPRVLWRTPIGGGYAGPAVADGLVYVTDWRLAAGAKVPDNPFARANAAGKERLLCLDISSGKTVWEHQWETTYKMSYPAGPRATPEVSGGKVYALGAMGDLVCLDAKKGGKPIWSKNFMRDYGSRLPVWGFSANPLIDGNKVICLVGGKGNVVVAFDKDTGKELWKALSLEAAEVGYCPPMIYTINGKRQLIIWHPEAVCSLDPETGKTLWKYEWLIKANLSIPTPRQIGNKLFITAFYDGCVLLEVNADNRDVKEVWRSKGRSEQPRDTDGLHSIMPTPVIQGESIYGVCSYGQLRCLNLSDGKRVWSDTKATGPYKELTRWANAFLIPHTDRFFLFNEKGDLIIAKLTPRGYEELERAHILDPTYPLSGKLGGERKVLWSHPAFANKTMFARNDKEIIAVSLAE